MDFLKYFNRLEICNLSPDSLTEEQMDAKKWETRVFEGKWVRGVTAGGCIKYLRKTLRNIEFFIFIYLLYFWFILIEFIILETFWHNPQYTITLSDVDEDEDDKCTLIVALMQKNKRSQKSTGVKCLSIGFALFKV
jgi:calpain